ncbi:dual specificity protein phosphatase 22 isoform X3 [Mesocricetus auratus]|uniref:Dual specificity protein phosphatase 22 isoform X3 n=1 Tax=Mesocricetus auratus TaxID=10036 RepID=A0ABM2YAI7_MESAU|nr:dual specificity protein phosphatase 22 isoform X3 [Mesocricetus auratus]
MVDGPQIILLHAVMYVIKLDTGPAESDLSHQVGGCLGAVISEGNPRPFGASSCLPLLDQGSISAEILPGLYIGNFKDARDAEQLSRNKVTHILSVHDSARPMMEMLPQPQQIFPALITDQMIAGYLLTTSMRKKTMQSQSYRKPNCRWLTVLSSQCFRSFLMMLSPDNGKWQGRAIYHSGS